jgi:hypothetical protein
MDWRTAGHELGEIQALTPAQVESAVTAAGGGAGATVAR